jgi:hypothetical protein
LLAVQVSDPEFPGQLPHIVGMSRVACFQRLPGKQFARATHLATLSQDDGHHDPRWATGIQVLRPIAPLCQNLLPGRKAVEEGTAAQFETTSDIIYHGVIGPSLPPDLLLRPRGLAHSGAHAALIFLNPGLGFAGPIVPRDLGNIDTQIDGEQTVQFSRNPRIEVVPGGSDAPI